MKILYAELSEISLYLSNSISIDHLINKKERKKFYIDQYSKLIKKI